MSDFVDRLSRTASSVTERSKQWLEVTRLRRELEQIEEKRSSALSALGERVYQQMRQGAVATEELAQQVKDIRDLDQRAAGLRRQIEVLAAPATTEGACPSCGRSNTPGDRFCVGCGQKLEAQKPSAPTCSACGAPLKTEARFCVSCGTPRPDPVG
jgi:DNA repair exonuclease SbcCD ATPase subunit